MDNLIAELEAATEGSRALDVKICESVAGLSFGKKFTTNLTDALTLVPEGLCWWVEFGPKAGGIAEVGTDNGPTDGFAATPALALCIAALRARQAMEGS